MSDADWRASRLKRLEAAAIAAIGYPLIAAARADVPLARGRRRASRVGRGVGPTADPRALARAHPAGDHLLPRPRRRRDHQREFRRRVDRAHHAAVRLPAGARIDLARRPARAAAAARATWPRAGRQPSPWTGRAAPAYQAQPGAVWLAKATGNPVVPFHVESSPCWTLGSWDRGAGAEAVEPGRDGDWRAARGARGCRRGRRSIRSASNSSSASSRSSSGRCRCWQRAADHGRPGGQRTARDSVLSSAAGCQLPADIESPLCPSSLSGPTARSITRRRPGIPSAWSGASSCARSSDAWRDRRGHGPGAGCGHARRDRARPRARLRRSPGGGRRFAGGPRPRHLHVARLLGRGPAGGRRRRSPRWTTSHGHGPDVTSASGVRPRAAAGASRAARPRDGFLPAQQRRHRRRPRAGERAQPRRGRRLRRPPR